MAGGIGGLPSSGPRGRPWRAGRVARWQRAGSHARVAAGSSDDVEPATPILVTRPCRPGPGGRAIREVPVAERPRERLALRGVGGLTAAELIGLVWGSGTRGRSAVDLAADALARHDGLTGLARATELELAEVTGIGEAKAAQLVAAFELGRRLLADWPAARWTIRGPHDVADRLILQMGRLEREELRVVHARHEEPRPARRDGLPGQRQLVAGPRRRAVPRRGPAQRRRA